MAALPSHHLDTAALQLYHPARPPFYHAIQVLPLCHITALPSCHPDTVPSGLHASRSLKHSTTQLLRHHSTFSIDSVTLLCHSTTQPPNAQPVATATLSHYYLDILPSGKCHFAAQTICHCASRQYYNVKTLPLRPISCPTRGGGSHSNPATATLPSDHPATWTVPLCHPHTLPPCLPGTQTVQTLPYHSHIAALTPCYRHYNSVTQTFCDPASQTLSPQSH